MPKQGEIDYIEKIGLEAAVHALGKPFSDPDCARYIKDIASILSLLPAPPGRLLDLGAGTGWTSVMYARRGYEVVGQDIAPAMIELAKQNQERAGLTNLRFIVGDYETLGLNEEFDCAVFYDSLHHAVDERAALLGAYAALRPGGVCLTVEPGEGHGQGPAAREAVRLYGVTEKDMPPRQVIRLGKAVGFRRAQVFGRFDAPPLLFDSEGSWLRKPGRIRRFLSGLKAMATGLWRGDSDLLGSGNIVLLQK